MTGEPVLTLEGVSASYGPFRALFDIDLSVGEGQALALLGANGAGKTTAARVCSGLLRPTSGVVRHRGVDLARKRPFEIARAGLVQAPEGRSVFATLTVEENLELWFRHSAGKSEVVALLDSAYEAFPRLGERRHQVAGTMSGGEQRMLSLARVLVDPPDVLVADELSLGLAPIIADEVYRTLARIKELGTTLVIVEQQIPHALALADEAAVLRSGRVIHQGPAAEVAELAEELLLGGEGD